MEDALKFIFKTLIKIPFIIMITYFIANLLLFSLFYFKFTGISYSVMNTAMENNFIPDNEYKIIEKTIKDIEGSSVLIGKDSAKIVVNGSNKREQYGTPITVGVEYKYRWLTPLMPWDLGQTPSSYGSGSSIIDDSTASEGNFSSITAEEAKRRIDVLSDRSLTSPIRIVYKVPGLQYYADLP